MRPRLFLSHFAPLLVLALGVTQARADLSQKQARKAISTAVVLELPGDSVHVDKITMIDPVVAETSAEIEIVFRVTEQEHGNWRLREIRVAQGRWEDLDAIARAAQVVLPSGDCDTNDQLRHSRNEKQLSVKRARCLVATLFGVTLPSNAVRIKEVSRLSLPLGTHSSALAKAIVQADFRLNKEAGHWRVVEFKSGNRVWKNLETLPVSVDQVKRSLAAEDLMNLSKALDAFRKERGFFVISDKHSVLIDHLIPRYLARTARFDPWHHPYEYQGERDRYTIRSNGPDAKPNTSDDVVVSNSAP
jgi:Type II secretion system (T2SS), protein G